jgi:hypothetical protein
MYAPLGGLIEFTMSGTFHQIKFMPKRVHDVLDPYMYQLVIDIETLLEVQTKQSVLDPENWQADKYIYLITVDQRRILPNVV